MIRPRFDILSIEKIIEKSNIIFHNHPEIKLGYVYGSYIRGNLTQYSDIDIGIVLAREYRPNSLYPIKILGELDDLFSKEFKVSIDLRILNNLSPIFLNQAVRKGKLIYEADHCFRINYELYVMHEYFDFQPFLQKSQAKFIERVLNEEY